MSQEKYTDYKKKIKKKKKELENSKPMFDDDSIEFNDFDNLISSSENIENEDDSDNSSHLNDDYPNITLETDDILMNLTIKKDYSSIVDLDKRKEEFIKDLKEFIDEFDSAEESNQLMEYYEQAF